MTFKTSRKVSNVSGILPISVRLRFKQHLALCWCEGGGGVQSNFRNMYSDFDKIGICEVLGTLEKLIIFE